MKISLIVAAAQNNSIGFNNDPPWGRGLKADLKKFKELTTGHAIIMGRKTFESIGKALPNRTNIVLTRDPAYEAAGCVVFTDIDKALNFAASQGETEAFVIGGANIFMQILPKADKIYLTRVHANMEGDTYFPEIASPPWRKVSEEKHSKDGDNIYDYTFELWQRHNANLQNYYANDTN